jgi:tripartite-type tricarboxylate transporter receptor subunit TctC
MTTLGRSLASCAIAFAAVAAAAPVQAQDDVGQFYRGKTITIIVGSSSGGGYDTYARLIARFFGKHVPGSPQVIVSNMPGSGGHQAATHIYAVAAKDGTQIGAPQSGTVLEPLIGSRPFNHDPSKFNYLGSANDDVYICIGRKDAVVKSFKDAFTTELILGASASSSTSDNPVVINNVLGTKFKIVTGYTGSREISLAISRNEAQGACGLAWPSISVTNPGWFGDKGQMQVLVQTHAMGHTELNAAGVPKITDFAKTPEQKAILDLYFSQTVFGRPYIVAPEVPADRVAALRKAFTATMTDAELVSEAQRIHLDIDFVPGDKLQDMVRKIYSSPPELISKTREAVVPKL